MTDKYKFPFYIVHHVKHGATHFRQTAQEEHVSQQRMNDFIKSWAPNLEQVMGLHCFGLAGEWDWIGIFGVADMSYWVGFREAISREFPGHIEKYVSYPTISHDAFVTGTEPSAHFGALRGLGSLPGMAEDDYSH